MPLRETAPKLSPEAKYEENFPLRTSRRRLNARQAAIEIRVACLYCFDAPCIQACPTRIDVPGFIKRIMTSNLRGAARVILEANILGESCGRVCPTEVLCEGACVMVEKGEKAIEIGCAAEVRCGPCAGPQDSTVPGGQGEWAARGLHWGPGPHPWPARQQSLGERATA